MSPTEHAGVLVNAVRVEHHDEPLGIGEARPRVSWQVDTNRPGWQQAGYQIEVCDPRTGAVTSGERVDSPDSVLVPWTHPPLASRACRQVRVRVWGQDDAEPSAWSAPLTVEAGLLSPADWSAVFAGPDWDYDPDADVPPPLLRGEFTVNGPVASARLYATALGLYELELNGDRVGDQAFAPGWTSYHHRLRYQTYDVTELLRPGRNALGGWLADGWYRGRIGFAGGHRATYGTELALLAQLEISYRDGSTQTVGTGPDWRASPGPIRLASIYDGERYDARLAPAGWSTPDFEDTGWSPVRIVRREPTGLVAPLGPPVRRTEQVRPVEVRRSPSGRTIYDFGQNLVGRLRIRAAGPAGSTVRLRHAEVLQDGELCVRPLRAAMATDEYILRGAGEEEWEPRFTFHGFRYAEVTGDVQPTDVVACVYHTDLRPTGTFHCSNPLVQRLHDNVVWSLRGNFLDIPTDCPQRDERLGWTGDIQVFAPTATFLYDCAGMLGSWLRDLAADQLPDGTVPFFVPAIFPAPWRPFSPAAAWGDAAVLTPWQLYQRFGDIGVLREQYPSAKAWVDCVAAHAGENHLWDEGPQFGDWLDPSAPPDDPAAAKSDRYLVATAYHAHSAAVLAEIANLLGHKDDHQHYARLAGQIRAAFVDRWVTESGLLRNDAQTSYALALCFDLLPTERQRRTAGDRLAELVRADGHHIATGFAGTPLICDALTGAGHADTAYSLLLQRECPSWLYPVTQGATTVWERWDSMLPDGTVNPGEMTSFNHYALGAVADWLHRTVAGLAPAEPGYRRLLVRPRPGGDLWHAAATHQTPYGPAEVGWRIDGETFTLDLRLPTGTTATVDLPGQQPVEVASGAHSWQIALRQS